MSDVLIKGMRMPLACYCCHFHGMGEKERWCCNMLPPNSCWSTVLDEKKFFLPQRDERCPLVEVPPHGRLIDAEAVSKLIKDRCCAGCDNHNGVRCRDCGIDDALACVEDAPTALEASDPRQMELFQEETV